MKIRSVIAVLVMITLGSCFSSRKGFREEIRNLEHAGPCGSINELNSLTISKVKAEILLDGELYEGRITLHYIPDTVIFLTAANTGFEIVRAAITPDSIIFINRIDKMVFIIREGELGYKAPVAFHDLEYLLNKYLVCEKQSDMVVHGHSVVIDRSIPNIDRKIEISPKTLKIKKFEFFHKKSGEYIVGETGSNDSLEVYSNYIFDDVELVAAGGVLEYNRELKVDLSFNKNKYFIIEK